jgi:death-on-curing protein
MAAAYLFHIVQNHPFVDGNKRAGVAAGVIFLRINDFSIDTDEAVFENLVRAVAEGRAGKTVIANFLRTHAQPVE